LDLDSKIYKKNKESGGFKKKFIISFYDSYEGKV
jgi:hypothetical protein